MRLHCVLISLCACALTAAARRVRVVVKNGEVYTEARLLAGAVTPLPPGRTP
jgi:hypothetical protein